MPLINTSVPNLIQGVSQQPDATRFAGQCEEQVNALSSVAEGLKKRPNTRHIAKLMDTALAAGSFVHFIDRDDDEKFVIIHDGTLIRIFNIVTGNLAKINGNWAHVVDDTYLDVSNPTKELKALTVADNTFLLNTTVVTKESTATTPDVEGRALVFVKQGDYQKTYSVDFGATAASATIQYQLRADNGDEDDD